MNEYLTCLLQPISCRTAHLNPIRLLSAQRIFRKDTQQKLSEGISGLLIFSDEEPNVAVKYPTSFIFYCTIYLVPDKSCCRKTSFQVFSILTVHNLPLVRLCFVSVFHNHHIKSTVSEEVQNMPMDMVTPHNRNKSDKLFDITVPLKEQR